jgi:1-phosphofructokinase family hexose kinase
MINTVTLNPAVDKLLFVDQFEKTVTARIERQADALGGKGVHISINLALMDIESAAFGILFGKTGRIIEDALTDMGVLVRFVWGAEDGRESRTNYVIIEADKTSTIVADRGVTLSGAEVRDILEKLREHTANGDMLALSGDASNVDDPFIYNRVMEALSDRKARVFIDASGEALKRAVEAAPFLVKPNRDELETLTGEKIVTEADVVRGIHALARRGIENIAVSLGGEGSVVLFGDALWRAAPPKVPVENTVGCGDCFLSGLIAGFYHGWGAERTLRYATAASAATAASPATVGFDVDYADELLDQVNVVKL